MSVLGLKLPHPGEMIRCDSIPDIPLEQYRELMAIPGIAAVIAEEAPITEAIAAALGALWGGDGGIWLRMQTQHDESQPII